MSSCLCCPCCWLCICHVLVLQPAASLLLLPLLPWARLMVTGALSCRIFTLLSRHLRHHFVVALTLGSSYSM